MTQKIKKTVNKFNEFSFEGSRLLLYLRTAFMEGLGISKLQFFI